jgi:hypothetical protein
MLQETDIFYAHYGYVKKPSDVFRRWKLYSNLEGNPNFYDGRNPDTILDHRDKDALIFTHEHPEVIKKYIESGQRIQY